MTTHFVSASCEGNGCSVCKAPAQHKLGEILSDDPANACSVCNGTWRWDGPVSTWMRDCIHCGIPHFYNDADDDSEDCKRCKGELHPVSTKPCGDFFHHTTGPVRHNLTAYVCCAHFTMIVGTAAGCPPLEVMRAGIVLERAKLERDNHELRGALIEICDQFGSRRMAMVLVRAIRAAANRTAQPFVLADIQNAVAGKTIEALARRLADATDHCLICADCGDGPCCERCDVRAAADLVRAALDGAR